MRMVKSVVQKLPEWSPSSPLFNDLLILLALLILLVEIYGKLRQTWLRHMLSQKKKGQTTTKTARAAHQERAQLPLLPGR